MVDVLSGLGVGLGAVSLVLQLVDQCMIGYRYFTEASDMPKSYQYLKIRVKIEQQRFVAFACESGLLTAGNDPCHELRVNFTVLKPILIQIRDLFVGQDKILERYITVTSCVSAEANDSGNLEELREGLLFTLNQATNADEAFAAEHVQPSSRVDTIESESFFGRAKRTTRKIRATLSEPHRFAWVHIDKEKIEGLIFKLTELNSFLVALLNSSQARRLESNLERNLRGILQLQTDVTGLKNLVNALGRVGEDPNHKMPRSKHSDTSENGELRTTLRQELLHDTKIKEDLRGLASVKMRRLDINKATKALDISSFRFHVDKSHVIHPRRVSATWDRTEVWIDWIDSSESEEIAAASGYGIEDRVSLLAHSLSGEKPAGFRVPICHGYIRQKSTNKRETQFGLVFGKTERESKTDSGVSTLRQLLRDKQKPPLSARINLALVLTESIDSFHAIDWLHKGLRSDNIVFIRDSSITSIDIGTPYISGFDLSRPSDIPEMTRKASFDPSKDMYRHPNAQFGNAEGSYRKSYDIYSLGIVLLEIATWKPVEALMGFSKNTKVLKETDLRQIRQQILGPWDGDRDRECTINPIQDAAAECGDAFGRAVEMSLEACSVEKPMHKRESNFSINSRLGIMYEEHVIAPLRKIHQAVKID